MAKVDRKNKENQQGEKHSLSSFEKKRGAKIAFNYAQARTNKKYRVINVQKEHRDISPTGKIIHGEKSVNVPENENTAKPVKNTAGRTFTNGQTANRRGENHTPGNAHKSESTVREKSYIKYESNCEAFMPLHVEMNSDILTIAQTTVQNGDLMYDPRIDFKVDYENKKVIPLSFENSFQGVYEEYDISDGKPETMKQINDILAFADDWMDEIEVQGYSPVTGDEEIQQTKENISL